MSGAGSHWGFDLYFPNDRRVKAMVFPVVMGCESWTVKKAER